MSAKKPAEWEPIASTTHENTARLKVDGGSLYKHVHYAGGGTPPGVGLVFVPDQVDPAGLAPLPPEPPAEETEETDAGGKRKRKTE